MPFTEMHSSLGLYSFLQSCLRTGWWHLAPTHTVLVHLLHHPSTACWTSCSNLFYEKPQTQQTEIYNAFLFDISNAQVSFPLDFTVSINWVSSCFNELRTLKKVCAQQHSLICLLLISVGLLSSFRPTDRPLLFQALSTPIWQLLY